MNKNNTTTPIVAILMIATLVVGATFAATTITPSAFAGGKKVKQDRYNKGPQDNQTRDNGNDSGGNGNGNTVTVQKNRQGATQSGFDNTQEQEAQNLICTHPSSPCTVEGTEAGNATGGSSSSSDGHGSPGHN